MNWEDEELGYVEEEEQLNDFVEEEEQELEPSPSFFVVTMNYILKSY